MSRAPFDLQSEFRRMFAPCVPDTPAPRESVAGTFASIDAHLSAHEKCADLTAAEIDALARSLGADK